MKRIKIINKFDKNWKIDYKLNRKQVKLIAPSYSPGNLIAARGPMLVQRFNRDLNLFTIYTSRLHYLTQLRTLSKSENLKFFRFVKGAYYF